VQASLQQRLIERKLTDAEIDQLSVMSMSGVAAEAQTYEEVSALDFEPRLTHQGPPLRSSVSRDVLKQCAGDWADAGSV
jgi:hypothetical protein